MTNQDRAAMIDTALKKHEMNCCMFERGVQTLDDLLASREVLLAALQSQQLRGVSDAQGLPSMAAPAHTTRESSGHPTIQAAAEPVVVGTKTWFENGKMVVQNLTADEVYKTDPTPPTTKSAEMKAALVKCRDALMALDAETNPICEGNYCDSIDSAYTAARAAIAETERVIG